MTTNDAADASDPPPAGDAGGARRTSLLDELAGWSVETQKFVHRLEVEYRRWNNATPNSAGQRQKFERVLRDLVADATSLENRLLDIGARLPDPPRSLGLDDGDQAASSVYRQLVETHFVAAWRQMVRLLERQLVDIQEPKTAEQWREFFRRFDAIWRGAQELGKAAGAARNLLDELVLGPGVRPQDGDGVEVSRQQQLLEEIAAACGELVNFLTENEILREDGLPPTRSKEIVGLHITRTGSGGARRLDALTPRLERYLDLLDQLIELLQEESFLPAGGAGEGNAARLRQELLQLLAVAKHRYEIASGVLHAALQLADPIFVAPREALHHAMDVAGALQDLTLRDQRFGIAVKAAENLAAGREVPVRSWGELDEVERAIIDHLRRNGQALRSEIEQAIRKSSPSTVWRRLKALRGERLVESILGPQAKTPPKKPSAGISALLGGKKGSSPGGSAPQIFRLTSLGGSLKPVEESP